MNSKKFEGGTKHYNDLEAEYAYLESEIGEILLEFMRENSITKGTILVNNNSAKEGYTSLTVTLYWEE